MTKKPRSRPNWNAQVKEMMEEGYDIHSAFESIESALKLADQPDVVSILIGGERSDSSTQKISIRRETLSKIVDAWQRYKAQDGAETLGQSFELEGSSRGRHRALGRLNRRIRDTSAGILVESNVAAGLTREMAIELTARELNMSPDNVKKAIAPPNPKKLQKHIARIGEKDR